MAERLARAATRTIGRFGLGLQDGFRAVRRRQDEHVSERLAGVELARGVAEVEALDADALPFSGQDRPGSDCLGGRAGVVDVAAADDLRVALPQGVQRRRRGADRVDHDRDVAGLERLTGRERRIDGGLAHPPPSAARAAASRAIGTRKGEQET